MDFLQKIKAKRDINFVVLAGTYNNPKRFIQNSNIKALVPYNGKPMIIPVIEAIMPYAQKIVVCGNARLLEEGIVKHIKKNADKIVFVDETADLYKKLIAKDIGFLRSIRGIRKTVQGDMNDALNIITNAINASIMLNSVNDFFFVLGCDIPDINEQLMATLLDDFSFCLENDIKLKGKPSSFYISLGNIVFENYYNLKKRKRPPLVLNQNLQVRIGNIHLLNLANILKTANIKKIFHAINKRKLKDHPFKSFLFSLKIFTLKDYIEVCKLLFNIQKYYNNNYFLKPFSYFKIEEKKVLAVLSNFFGFEIQFVHTVGSDDIDTDEEYYAKLQSKTIGSSD
ncbi:MAG: NTP transferase domain-containing protein [Candidatus Magnetoovum sp. WYHC-5]|nr:NTP transferase domain-containing protein [Candidatus Magnetoovum sp. WYHC-5]